jgi:hypothetical protein
MTVAVKDWKTVSTHQLAELYGTETTERSIIIQPFKVISYSYGI